MKTYRIDLDLLEGKFFIADLEKVGYVNADKSVSMDGEHVKFNTIDEAQKYVRDELDAESVLSPMVESMGFPTFFGDDVR